MRITGGGRRVRAFPRLLLALPTALLGLACHGCAPDDADPELSSRSAASRSPARQQDRTGTDRTREAGMPDDTADSLRLHVEAPDNVPRGQPVPVTFRVENVTDRTLTLHLTGREIAFDILVERPDGSTVWRRLEGEVIRSILRLDTLPPGQSLRLQASWDQRSDAGEPVPPGEYRVRAELLTEGEPLRSPARPLRITAG